VAITTAEKLPSVKPTFLDVTVDLGSVSQETRGVSLTPPVSKQSVRWMVIALETAASAETGFAASMKIAARQVQIPWSVMKTWTATESTALEPVMRESA
jgi:hypothetical protein